MQESSRYGGQIMGGGEMKSRMIPGIMAGLFILFIITGVSTGILVQKKVRVIITVDRDFDEKTIPGLNGVVIAKGRIFPVVIAELPEKAVDRIKNARGVVRVEHDKQVHLLGKPSKPPGKNKNRFQPPQTIPWGVSRIKAPDAWNVSDGSANGVIEVAILDTGIDYNHPDLADNLVWGVSVLHGRVSEKQKDYRDVNGHGTHVSGIVSAIDNGIGVVGVAPGAELYAVKVLGNNGNGWVSDIILGIEQALLGPDGVLDADNDGVIVGDPQDDAPEVISMSFGSSADVQALHDAISEAYVDGVVLVAASGNEGSQTPDYPSAYPEVIAVGAVDSNDQPPSWSNRGVEVSAPGVGIFSTYPDDVYTTMSGTSMAAPHVSGVVALIQAVHYVRYGNVLPVGDSDDTSKGSVRGILHLTAEDVGQVGWDAIYGYGVVRADLAVQNAQ